jgi:protein TonB
VITEKTGHGFWFFLILAAALHGILIYNFATVPDIFRDLKQEQTPIRVKLRSTLSTSVAPTLTRPEKLKVPSVSSPFSPPSFKALQHAGMPNRSKPLKIKGPEIKASAPSPLQSVLLKAPSLDKSVPLPKVEFGPKATEAGASPSRRDQNAISGKNEAAGDVKSGYLALVRKMIEEKRRYPLAARRALQEGAANVRFRILKSGALDGRPQLVASSGYAVLDQAALDCVEEASPFPPIPSNMGFQDLELNLNIVFRLEE